MNLAYRPTRFPASLEKLYVDALLEDGTVLLVYLGVLCVFRARLARVTAELHLPDGRVVRGDAGARRASGGEGFLRTIPLRRVRSATTERADTLQLATETKMRQFRTAGVSVFRLQRIVQTRMGVARESTAPKAGGYGTRTQCTRRVT